MNVYALFELFPSDPCLCAIFRKFAADILRQSRIDIGAEPVQRSSRNPLRWVSASRRCASSAEPGGAGAIARPEPPGSASGSGGYPLQLRVRASRADLPKGRPVRPTKWLSCRLPESNRYPSPLKSNSEARRNSRSPLPDQKAYATFPMARAPIGTDLSAEAGRGRRAVFFKRAH